MAWLPMAYGKILHKAKPSAIFSNMPRGAMPYLFYHTEDLFSDMPLLFLFQFLAAGEQLYKSQCLSICSFVRSLRHKVSLLGSGRMDGPINGYVGSASVLVSAINYTCKNCYQHSYDSYFSSKLYPLFFNMANFSVAASPLNVHVYEVYRVRCQALMLLYVFFDSQRSQ